MSNIRLLILNILLLVLQGDSDPYVRVLIDSDEVARSKTVKNNLSPEWNESMIRSIRLYLSA